MSTLIAEHGAPVYTIFGPADLALLVLLILSGLASMFSRSGHSLGFCLAIFLSHYTGAHLRLFIDEPGALGLGLAVLAMATYGLTWMEARRSGATWSRVASQGFGLSSAVVGIGMVLAGGPAQKITGLALLPSAFVLACAVWGVWVERRTSAVPKRPAA